VTVIVKASRWRNYERVLIDQHWSNTRIDSREIIERWKEKPTLALFLARSNVVNNSVARAGENVTVPRDWAIVSIEPVSVRLWCILRYANRNVKSLEHSGRYKLPLGQFRRACRSIGLNVALVFVRHIPGTLHTFHPFVDAWIYLTLDGFVGLHCSISSPKRPLDPLRKSETQLNTVHILCF